MIVKYLCVEDLKIFKPHHIEALFGDEAIDESSASSPAMFSIMVPNCSWEQMNRIFIPKQSLDVVGLKDLEILHTQIFANHLEFGNNDIIGMGGGADRTM